MSDFDNDIDFENDFDDSGDVSNDNATNTEHSVSEVDAVADLLMGGDGSGHKAKANDSGMRSRDLDGHGRVDYSSNASQQEDPAYMANESAPDTKNAEGRVNHFSQKQVDINHQWGQLQQMRGDMNPDQFAHMQQNLQGQMAGATIALQQAQIEAMQNQSWMSNQEALVREKHADVFNDPQKREIYGRKMTDYLGSIGYSRAELAEIGAREYNAVLDHIKVTEERDHLKLQVAKFKQERRNRNKSLKQGRRDIETGAGRNKKGGDSVYDEVARILGGGK